MAFIREFLLDQYATNRDIKKAAEDLRNVNQKSSEVERTFFQRFEDMHAREAIHTTVLKISFRSSTVVMLDSAITSTITMKIMRIVMFFVSFVLQEQKVINYELEIQVLQEEKKLAFWP